MGQHAGTFGAIAPRIPGSPNHAGPVSALLHGYFLAVLAPARVERTFGFEAPVGVGAKIVSQTLKQVGGPARAAQSVVIAQRGREGRDRNAMFHRQPDDLAPGALGLQHGVPEIILQDEVGNAPFGLVGRHDPVKEAGSDDAPATPDGGDLAEPQIPGVFFGSRGHLLEALSISDDLGGVERVANGVDVAGLRLAAGSGLARQLLLGFGAEGALARENAGVNGFGDASQRHTKIKSVAGGPAASAFLLGLV